MVQELDTLMCKILSYAKRCMEDGAYASIGEMGVPHIRGDDPVVCLQFLVCPSTML